MPAGTDTSFTVREDGFDHAQVSYRAVTDEADVPYGFVFDIDCEESGANINLSLEVAEELSAAIHELVLEAKSRLAPKPTTKPKK